MMGNHYWCLFLLLGVVGIRADMLVDDVCGDTNFNATTGNISGLDPGVGKSCNYTITADDNVKQVAITFAKINLNPAQYNLVVYGGENVTSGQVIANLSDGYSDYPYVLVVSGYKVTRIVISHLTNSQAQNAKDTTFTATYSTEECVYQEKSLGGVIWSPIYLPNNGSISCTYTETLLPQSMFVLSFLEFTVPNGTVSIKFDNSSATTYDGSTIPADLFSKTGAQNIQINVTFKSAPKLQKFTALFQSVDQRCSGKFTANKTANSLSIPSSNSLPIKCYAQISASEGQVYIEDVGTQANALDTFAVYDGASTKSNQIGTQVDRLSWYVSSGKTMTMVAQLGTGVTRNNKLQYRQDKVSTFVALSNTTNSVTKTWDGENVNSTLVMAQFLATDLVNNKVKIEVGSGTKLTGASITVTCAQGTTTFTFTKDTAPFPIVMPTSRTLIKITNLKKGETAQIKATAVLTDDCHQLLTGNTGEVAFVAANTTEKLCNVMVAPASTAADVILELSSVKLCTNGTLDIYQGFSKNAPKLLSLAANTTITTIPKIRFPAGSGPSLVWTGNPSVCIDPTVVGRYWIQDSDAACGVLGTSMSGTIQTPNYPNQYPLNSMCKWKIPAVKDSKLYLSVSDINLPSGAKITLQNDKKAVVTLNGTVVPPDSLVPNANLSLTFSAPAQSAGVGMSQAGQGAQLSYRVLTCGNVLDTASGSISLPNTTNSSADCLWIIKVPANGTAHSVNIVSANIRVIGYKNKDNGSLEIHDGSSASDRIVTVDMSGKNTTKFMSRTNALFVRFMYTKSSSSAFTLSFNFSSFNCNSSSLCDNGICIHPNWWCDGVLQCADGKDEIHCNGTQPIPHTGGDTGKKGVPGVWIFISILIGIVTGILLAVMVPKCIRSIRHRNNARASNYGSLHEDT